jgi:hypothetical protein
MKRESPNAYQGFQEQNRGGNVDKKARDPHNQWNAKKANRYSTRYDGHPFDSEKEAVSRMVSETENKIANKPSHRE